MKDIPSDFTHQQCTNYRAHICGGKIVVVEYVILDEWNIRMQHTLAPIHVSS